MDLTEEQKNLYVHAIANYTSCLSHILAASAKHDRKGINDALNYLVKNCAPMLSPTDYISGPLRNFFEESVPEYVDVLLNNENMRKYYQ